MKAVLQGTSFTFLVAAMQSIHSSCFEHSTWIGDPHTRIKQELFYTNS